MVISSCREVGRTARCNTLPPEPAPSVNAVSMQSSENHPVAETHAARGRVHHLSRSERVAIGKAARTDVPRSRHAAFDPPADRPDPIALLAGQAESRVPELVPIRYGRMLVSP